MTTKTPTDILTQIVTRADQAVRDYRDAWDGAVATTVLLDALTAIREMARDERYKLRLQQIQAAER